MKNNKYRRWSYNFSRQWNNKRLSITIDYFGVDGGERFIFQAHFDVPQFCCVFLAHFTFFCFIVCFTSEFYCSLFKALDGMSLGVSIMTPIIINNVSIITSFQVFKFSSFQVSKFPSFQVFKFSNFQVFKFLVELS